MKKALTLMSFGVFNLLHASFHIIQFIQSMMIVAYSTHHEPHNDGFIDSLMHNPIVAIIFAIIGISSIVMGVKDYRHHKRCENEDSHEH
jgi:hypothetical protein